MSLYLGLAMEMPYPAQSMRYPFQAVFSPIRCAQCFPTAIYWNRKEPIILRISNSLASLSFVREFEFKSVASVRSLYSMFGIYNTDGNSSLFEAQAMEKDTRAESSSMSEENHSDMKTKEEERRRKISLANKGKVPWNKGRKHSEDTRERIKQRTREALRNPQVRKKMSDHQQPHSDESKEKIRASVKQIWAERSRLKRSKEKFTSLWAQNIAEAARKGGKDQVELEWDSYDKIKQKISSEQLELAAEKARTKQQNKIKAEEAAEARAERMRKLAERKIEREEKDRREGKIRKPKRNKEQAAIASRSKLKQRLTKIHKKKTSLGKIAIGKDKGVSVATKLEKLDLELIKKERRGYVSLADQIQAAKNKRGTDSFDIWSFCHEF